MRQSILKTCSQFDKELRTGFAVTRNILWGSAPTIQPIVLHIIGPQATTYFGSSKKLLGCGYCKAGLYPLWKFINDILKRGKVQHPDQVFQLGSILFSLRSCKKGVKSKNIKSEIPNQILLLLPHLLPCPPQHLLRVYHPPHSLPPPFTYGYPLTTHYYGFPNPIFQSHHLFGLCPSTWGPGQHQSHNNRLLRGFSLDASVTLQPSVTAA